MVLTPAPVLLAALLLPGPVPGQGPGGHPSTEEAFAEALGLKRARLATAPGLELWCEDSGQFRELEKPVLEAWRLASGWLGGLGMPEGVTARVVVLEDAAALRGYPELLRQEAAIMKVTVPGPELMEGVIKAGSAIWSNPPTVLAYGTILHKDHLLTRIVHDLGALRARFAISPYGAEPPEFLKEGFAGMLVRHAVKKPVALVSHERAALTSTIHGYGVFANIGAQLNDNSNDPGSWPGILNTAVKAQRKLEVIPPEARVDGLLQRTFESFARTDYAYAWAVVEFLFDERMPYGPAAVEAAGQRRWTPPREPLEQSRRTVLLQALEVMRRPEFVGLDAPTRGERLGELLMEGYGEDAGALHDAFMLWVEKAMPRK